MAIKKSDEQQKIAAILDMLSDARKDIYERLSNVLPESYQCRQLRWNLYDIDCARVYFAKRIEENPLEPPKEPEGQRPLGRIDVMAIEISQDHVVPLEDGISAEMARKIEKILRRAQLVGQRPDEIVQQVGRVLTGGERPLIFSEVYKRAERLTFHELHDISNKAKEAHREMYARRAQDNAP